MAHRAGQVAEGGFEHLARLERAGAGRGLAGAQIPHPPGCAVEDRFDEDGSGGRGRRGCAWCATAHGVGEGVVPRALVVDRVALRIAGGQRLDQRAFRRGDAADQRERRPRCVIGAGERGGLAGGIHQLPGKVVVRPGGVADAPMRHGAVRVGRQRLLEAGDSLLVVVAEAPVEAAIEPPLGVRRGGGHLAGVGAEIIGIVHVASSALCGDVGPQVEAACFGRLESDCIDRRCLTATTKSCRTRRFTTDLLPDDPGQYLPASCLQHGLGVETRKQIQ